MITLFTAIYLIIFPESLNLRSFPKQSEWYQMNLNGAIGGEYFSFWEVYFLEKNHLLHTVQS